MQKIITLKSGATVTFTAKVTLITPDIDGHRLTPREDDIVKSIQFTIANNKNSKSTTARSLRFLDAKNMFDTAHLAKGAEAIVEGDVGGVLISRVTYDQIKPCWDELVAFVEAETAKIITDNKINTKTKTTEALIVNPEFAHLSVEQLSKLERQYDAVHNEGADGFNPYRDMLLVPKSN